MHTWSLRAGIGACAAALIVFALRLPAADPTNFVATQVGSGAVRLTWTNPETYAGLRLFRDGKQLVDLPGSATSYLDAGVPVGSHVYALRPCRPLCPDTFELGTHVVKIYLDGATTPSAIWDVTAGTGSEVTNVGYLAIGVGSTAQSGALDVDFLRFAPGANAPEDSSYAPPPGGWAYEYEANPGEDAATPDASALDGTWNHNNGSDAWDLSPIGGELSATNRPGGAMVTGEAAGSWLRIQDPGDPRGYGMPDPSNRKIYFYHDLAAEGVPATVLDTGATLYFRIRVPTDAPIDPLYPASGGETQPYPSGGDGYLIHDNGKGNIGIKQASGGIISFSLAAEFDRGAGMLLTNNLNGKSASAEVDTGEAGTLNALPLDATVWHDVWVSISGGTGATGPDATVEVLDFVPPQNFACVQKDGAVELSWENASAYSAIRIFRDGRLIAEVPGAQTSYVDPDAPAGMVSYKVIPCLGAICADTLELGTHVVKIYLDGALEPVVFDVTAGDGQDYPATYLAMGLGATFESGALDVDFVRVAAGKHAPGDPSYPAPASGWAYAYEANAGQDSPGDGSGAGALDGTWNHENSSDAWDGSGTGGEFGLGNAPGGAAILEESYLRIQDPGDPTDYGYPDPSNRKIYFGRDLAPSGFGQSALDDGVTIHFRVRVPTEGPLDPLHPDGGGGIAPYPEGGDGYSIHNGGKGSIGIRQAAGGIISFSLATGADGGALAMNALNGRGISGAVDTGEGQAANAVPLDPAQWHDVWAVISARTGLDGPSCSLKVCPLEGDTRCSGLEVSQLGKTRVVLAKATAEDVSGDPITYTFVATRQGFEAIVVGPQAEDEASFELEAGEWTISVSVDDDPECEDPPGTCLETIEVVECPAEGDTRCTALDLTQVEGTLMVLAKATAVDDSGDPLTYTFTAVREGAAPIVLGPQEENEALFDLDLGEWTISVSVDDDPECEDPPGECSGTIDVVLVTGGLQKPGDVNQDGKLDVSDPVGLLNHLFLGTLPKLPCGNGTTKDPANKALLDVNGDGRVDLSDAVWELNFLFRGGGRPKSCETDACLCVRIEGCPDNGGVGDCR